MDHIIVWLNEQSKTAKNTCPDSKNVSLSHFLQRNIEINMAKNILIVVLGILVVLFWLGDQSTEMDDRDPDIVFIEYKCSELLNYEYVPPEVLQECRERGLANRQHT